MLDVLIRPPIPGEGVAIARIHVRAWQEGYATLMPAGFLDGLDEAERGEAWDQRLVAHERAVPEAVGHEFLVADCRPNPDAPRALAGITTFGRERDPVGAGPPSMTGTTGEVWMINVLPGCWRSGVGTALLAAASLRLAELGFASNVLWVLEGNERARAFYERNGWTFDGADKLESFGGRELRELRYRRAALHGGGSASLM